jgi:hypothetical protein
VTDNLQNLCTTVMRGVVAAGVLDSRNDALVSRAVEIMRAEIKDFLTADCYAAERELVLHSPMNVEGVVVASMVASCVLKINAEKVS